MCCVAASWSTIPPLSCDDTCAFQQPAVGVYIFCLMSTHRAKAWCSYDHRHMLHFCLTLEITWGSHCLHTVMRHRLTQDHRAQELAAMKACRKLRVLSIGVSASKPEDWCSNLSCRTASKRCASASASSSSLNLSCCMSAESCSNAWFCLHSHLC